MESHIAQLNVAHALGTPDDPVMAPFMAQLDAINALAEIGRAHV